MIDDKKININTQGGTVITGGIFENVEFVAQKYVYNAEAKHEVKHDGIEEAVIATDNEQEKNLANPSAQEIPESIKVCFHHYSEFVRQQVATIVREFYLNRPVNLALIEIVLFDHGLLRNRNKHTPFVQALVEWGILPSDIDVRKTANGIADKFRKLPLEGYKQWDNHLLNERTKCIKIGKTLHESMKYNR